LARLVAVVAAAAVLGGGAFGVIAGTHTGAKAAVPVTVAPLTDTTVRPQHVQIVYQVADYTATPTRTSWEVLTDDRPFDETDLTYTTDPLLGSQPSGGTVDTLGAVYSLTAGHLGEISANPPTLGSGDQALSVELTDLVSRGLARAVGQSLEVAGRRCQVVRFSGPPNGPIPPLTGTDHDDLCLDSSGLVLSESWTYQSKLVLQRTAIEVGVGSVDPQIRPGPAPASASTAGSNPGLAVADGTNRASDFLAAPVAPAGFAAEQPVSVTVTNPSKPSQVVDRSTVWSFVSGGLLVTVEAGSGQLPWQSGDTTTGPETLVGLGAATSALESYGPEIRVQLSGGRWVRVDGTVPLGQLVAYADRLADAG